MKRFLALMVSLVLCVTNVRERRNTLRGNESRNRGICFWGAGNQHTIGCFDGGVYWKGNLREGGRWTTSAGECHEGNDIIVDFWCVGRWENKADWHSIRIGVCGVHGWLAGVFRAGRDTDCGYDDKMYCGGECERCLCGNGRAHLGQWGRICGKDEWAGKSSRYGAYEFFEL